MDVAKIPQNIRQQTNLVYIYQYLSIYEPISVLFCKKRLMPPQFSDGLLAVIESILGTSKKAQERSSCFSLYSVTVSEARKNFCAAIPISTTKSYFLRNREGKIFFFALIRSIYWYKKVHHTLT